MLLIALLSILNAGLHNDFVNSDAMRLTIFHLPVNIYDMFLYACLAWSFLPAGDSRFRVDRVSGTLICILIAFLLGLLLGIVGAMTLEAQSRWIITDARNFVAVLTAVVVGYRSTKNLGSAFFYCYVVVFSGILAATVIPLGFAHAAETLTTSRTIDTVRVIQYVSNYAGLGAAILIFCVGFRGKPMLPRWLCIGVAGYCVVGACATLSRSDWVSIAAALIAALAIIPSISPTRKVVVALVAVPVLAAFLFGGTYVAQQISGRDMFSKMTNRLWSIIGLQDKGISAGSGRWQAAVEEIRMWSSSPVTIAMGGGFATHEASMLSEDAGTASAFRHNTWASTLAETGLVGFTAMALVVVGQVVVGYGMVKRRLDRRTVIVGALGVITGVHFFVHGLTTMSFNQIRWAIPLGIMCGVVLRTRMIEKTLLATYAGYLPDPKDRRTPPTPLLDAGTTTRPPSILVSVDGRPQWAGQDRQEFAHY